MKTPYCTAAAIARRGVEEVRRAVVDLQAEMSRVGERSREVGLLIDRERAGAGLDNLLPETGWFAKMATEQRDLAVALVQLEARLEMLREDARSRLAAQQALDEAVAGFRLVQAKRRGRRDQLEADDRAAAVCVGSAKLRGQAAAR